MTKQRMIVTDDQMLIDMDLIFSAIDQADGNWEQVEKDMSNYVNMVQGMIKNDKAKVNTAKKRMVVTDDQLLIDMELLFNAIREAKGDWKKVSDDMNAYLDSIVGMVGE
ncbi:MAG: hypothetical protein QG639_382 [Patescibacteria group bacterium]|nr:hypothetical protein [Patescibacteria group bacterium]